MIGCSCERNSSALCCTLALVISSVTLPVAPFEEDESNVEVMEDHVVEVRDAVPDDERNADVPIETACLHSGLEGEVDLKAVKTPDCDGQRL